jgi:hypothetical protein
MDNLRKTMDAEIQKVLATCPDINPLEIRADIETTLSAIDTINRIFDGSFLSGTRLERKPEKTREKKPVDDVYVFLI